MALNARRQVFFCKLETTQGVDAVPTAADVVVARDFGAEPLIVDSIDRTVIRPYGGGFDNIIGSRMAKFTVTMDATGYGTAGGAVIPGYDALFQICGMARTQTAGTETVYNKITDVATQKSATVYFFYDGVLHKATSCKANLKGSGKRGKIPTETFEIMGIYGGTVDAAVPTVDLSAYIQPFRFRFGNATFPALMGKNAGLCVEDYSYDLGNDLQYFDRVDCGERVDIVNFNVTGSVTMEATRVATMDLPGKVIATTTEPFQLTLGTTAGNITKVLAPRAQPTSITYSEDNFVRMQAADLKFKPNAGNDDIVIKKA